MMEMRCAPIVISVYDRLEHLRRCVDSLKRNELASYSELYVISDAASKETDIPLIDAVRSYIRSIVGFKKVYPVFRKTNMGGNRSILTAFHDIFQIYDSFISLEDELLRLFGGERMQAIVEKMGVADDEAIEAGMLTKAIENAQKKVEGKNFSIRKYVLQYDNVMNKQRELM